MREFLHSHTAYELMPESGKVVLLDTELPVRQARGDVEGWVCTCDLHAFVPKHCEDQLA